MVLANFLDTLAMWVIHRHHSYLTQKSTELTDVGIEAHIAAHITSCLIPQLMLEVYTFYIRTSHTGQM